MIFIGGILELPMLISFLMLVGCIRSQTGWLAWLGLLIGCLFFVFWPQPYLLTLKEE